MKMKLPQLFPLPHMVNVRQVFLILAFLVFHSFSYASFFSGCRPPWTCTGGWCGNPNHPSCPNGAEICCNGNYYQSTINNCPSTCNGYPFAYSSVGSCVNGSFTAPNCYYYQPDPPDSFPPCSDFLPVSDSRCEGGQGVYFVSDLLNGALNISNVFGYLEDGIIWTPQIPQPQGDTTTRIDGSQCTLFGNSGSGLIYDIIVCPIGFSEDYSSSSSEDDQSSSSGGNDLCEEFPELPGCDNQGGGSSGSGGGGGDCTDFSNCDWAKLDVQLIQLGVEVETRNMVGDIVGLLQNGYNLSMEQYNALQNLRNELQDMRGGLTGAIGNGANNIIGAIDGLGNGMGSGFSDVVGALDGLRGAIDGLGSGLGVGGGSGGGGSSGSGGGGGGGSCIPLSQGSDDGIFASVFKYFFGGSGVDVDNDMFCPPAQMGDSLGDGSVVRSRMRNAIGIDSTSFTFFGTGGSCPVFNLSFDAGMVSCKLAHRRLGDN
jgi:hypothetical protein